MFDNPEIKKLQQDIDALSEIIGTLVETTEIRHADVMNKLELIEAKLEQEEEDMTGQMEDIKSEIEEVKIAVESVEGTLEEA